MIKYYIQRRIFTNLIDCVNNFNEGIAICCQDNSNDYEKEAFKNLLYGNDFKRNILGKECDSKD